MKAQNVRIVQFPGEVAQFLNRLHPLLLNATAGSVLADVDISQHSGCPRTDKKWPRLILAIRRWFWQERQIRAIHQPEPVSGVRLLTAEESLEMASHDMRCLSRGCVRAHERARGIDSEALDQGKRDRLELVIQATAALAGAAVGRAKEVKYILEGKPMKRLE